MKIDAAGLRKLVKETLTEAPLTKAQIKHMDKLARDANKPLPKELKAPSRLTGLWRACQMHPSGGEVCLGYLKAADKASAEALAEDRFGSSYTGNYGEVQPASQAQYQSDIKKARQKVDRAEAELQALVMLEGKDMKISINQLRKIIRETVEENDKEPEDEKAPCEQCGKVSVADKRFNGHVCKHCADSLSRD